MRTISGAIPGGLREKRILAAGLADVLKRFVGGVAELFRPFGVFVVLQLLDAQLLFLQAVSVNRLLGRASAFAGLFELAGEFFRFLLRLPFLALVSFNIGLGPVMFPFQ